MNKLTSLQLSQGITDLIVGLETDLIANIAAYLAAGRIEEDTAKWKMKKLAELGKLTKQNAKTIAEYAGKTPELLELTLQRAANSAIQELAPGLKRMVQEGLIDRRATPSMSGNMLNSLKMLQKQAKKDLNLTNTTMKYKAKNAAMQVINRTAELANKQEYIDSLNKATGKVVTGIEARQSAMRECIGEMAQKGIPAFVDKNGRNWTPEAYTNMCMRSTVGSVAKETQFSLMDEYGLDLVEASSHSGARPLCAKDQGKIFNRNGGGGYTTDLDGKRIRFYAWRSSSYGKPAGLLGINCGHQIYPFLPGISVQTYFPYDEKENAEQYDKICRQRELERRVRATKRECTSLDTLGDKEGFDKTAYKLKQQEQQLKSYCEKNGLTYKPDRTATPGYGRSQAAKTTASYKAAVKAEQEQIKLIDVDKSAESGIIKLGSKFLNEDDPLFKNADKIKPLEGFDDIVFHGDSTHLIAYGNDGEEWLYNAKEAAEIIRNSKSFHGRPIRLLSCQTGANKDGIAQQIADELNVEVLAPSETLFVDINGEMFITDKEELAEIWNISSLEERQKIRQTGEWIPFKPKKR